MARLRSSLADGPVYDLPPGRAVTVGRAEGSELRLSHRSVSARHAVLDTAACPPVLRDCGSRFGTYVGETHLRGEAAELYHGCSVHFGTPSHGATFTYEEDAAAAPADYEPRRGVSGAVPVHPAGVRSVEDGPVQRSRSPSRSPVRQRRAPSPPPLRQHDDAAPSSPPHRLYPSVPSPLPASPSRPPLAPVGNHGRALPPHSVSYMTPHGTAFYTGGATNKPCARDIPESPGPPPWPAAAPPNASAPPNAAPPLNASAGSVETALFVDPLDRARVEAERGRAAEHIRSLNQVLGGVVGVQHARFVFTDGKGNDASPSCSGGGGGDPAAARERSLRRTVNIMRSKDLRAKSRAFVALVRHADRNHAGALTQALEAARTEGDAKAASARGQAMTDFEADREKLEAQQVHAHYTRLPKYYCSTPIARTCSSPPPHPPPSSSSSYRAPSSSKSPTWSATPAERRRSTPS